MASSFMYVLMAGLAIFVVGGLLAGFVAEDAPGEEGDAVFSQPIGVIGGTADATSRKAVQVNDMLVEQQSLNATEISGESVKVSSSVFGGSSEVLTFEAVQPQAVYITFVPTRAGPDDHLSITVNGEPVTIPALDSGSPVTVSSTNVEAGTNVVQFTAKNPGIRAWRTPTYRLDSIDVVLADQKNERVIVPFRVYDYEVTGFDRGEVSYSVVEDTVRTSPLRIAVNGHTVSERLPIKRASPYTATFFANTTGLHPGENTVSFSTTGAAEYPLSNVQLDLFYYAGTERRTVVRSFNLSRNEYNRLGEHDGGRLQFYVERILQPGDVMLELTNRSFTVSPTPGANTVQFGQDAVVAGDNTLRISTVGSYRLSAFNITVPEPRGFGAR